MLAIQQGRAEAFVSLAGAGRSSAELLREQLAAQLSGQLLDQAAHILDELAAGRAVAEVPKELAGLFDPSIQPYLMSWFAHDPAQELAELSLPTLIAQGTTDTQVKLLDAQMLAAVRSDATLLIVEGMTHVLKEASFDPSAQQAATRTQPCRSPPSSSTACNRSYKRPSCHKLRTVRLQVSTEASPLRRPQTRQ